jgi:hypothetical protein
LRARHRIRHLSPHTPGPGATCRSRTCARARRLCGPPAEGPPAPRYASRGGVPRFAERREANDVGRTRISGFVNEYNGMRPASSLAIGQGDRTCQGEHGVSKPRGRTLAMARRVERARTRRQAIGGNVGGKLADRPGSPRDFPFRARKGATHNAVLRPDPTAARRRPKAICTATSRSGRAGKTAALMHASQWPRAHLATS